MVSGLKQRYEVLTPAVLSILGDPDWAVRLCSDDLRGLSPLIYTHINPARLLAAHLLMKRDGPVSPRETGCR